MTVQNAGRDLMREIADRPLPQTARPLLADFDRLTIGRQCVYVSTPLTTGPLFIQSKKSFSETEGLLKTWGAAESADAFRFYVDRLEPVIRSISSRFVGAAVINPGDLAVSGWEQLDFHRFWIEVIRRNVDVMVMADGWNLSNGSSLELCLATQLDLPILVESLDPLSPQSAAQKLRDGIREFKEVALDTTYLATALAAIEASSQAGQV